MLTPKLFYGGSSTKYSKEYKTTFHLNSDSEDSEDEEEIVTNVCLENNPVECEYLILIYNIVIDIKF